MGLSPGALPPNPIRYASHENRPKKGFENERQRAWYEGDLSNYLYNQTGPEDRLQRERYRGLGDEQYEDILQGRGGYRPGEIDQLRDTDTLEGLQLTPEERQARFLTEGEQGQIRGDPYSAFDYYDPRRFDEANYYGAQGQLGALGGASGRLRGMYGNEALGLDQGFAEGYPLSDEEVQQISDLGAKSAANRYRGIRENIDRVAGASGSPGFARAAMGGRLNRESAIASADAATQGRLGALGLQRDQRRTLEDMRLGAERYRTGLGTDTEFGLLNQQLGTARDIRNSALGTEEYLQNTGQALERYGEGELQRRQQEMAQNRQFTETGAQGERYQRGSNIAGERYGRERDIAQERLAQEREGRGYLQGQQGQYGGSYQQEADRRQRGQAIASAGSREAASGILGARQPSLFNRSIAPWLMQGANYATGRFG